MNLAKILNGCRPCPPENAGTARNPAAILSANWWRLSGVLVAAMLIATLAAAWPAAAYESFENGRLRFGNGGEASVNAQGNLQQPFYHDNILNGGGWFQLTYSSYPLNNAIAVGGDGTDNWNTSGTIVQDPALSGQVVDVSGFTRTSGTHGYGTIVSTGTVTVGAQSFQVQNIYSLGQNDAFVTIVTRVTNTGEMSLQNLRVWVGTQDDYVGTSDGPTKRRGNLVNGVFTDIAAAANHSAALQIESGATGVLFYSTSPRAYTSVNSCCSFSNAYQQNPATSAITATNDGSYALYVRMNDLAAGASDEFTWYYAAGELANLGSIAASVGAASSSGPVSLTLNTPVTPFVPVTISGGTPPYTYSISPALPAGLFFNTSTGQVTGTPTAISPGTVYTVTITDSASPPVSTSGTFTLGAKDTQTLIFPAQTATTQTFSNGGSFAINPTATGGASGSPVIYSSTTAGVCSVNGTTVYILAVGTCTLRASQAGDASYNDAPDVEQSIAIGKAGQSINFPAVGLQTFVASGEFSISASATSGLTVSFASLTSGICTVSGNSVTMVSPGTCRVRGSQAGSGNYFAAANVDADIQIGKLNQTIGFPMMSARTFVPSETFTVGVASSSGLWVSLASDTADVCSVSGITVTIISAGTCTLRASQPGSATYHAANDVVNQVVIEPAVQRLAFPAPSSQPLAGSPLALAATATSGLPVTFASQTPAVCTTAGVNGNTVTMAALGNCTIRASQAGNGNYVAATPVDRSFGVTQAVTQLTLTSSANIAAFGAPLALTANARGANPAGIVDFIVTYASATGTVTTPLCSGVPLVAGAAGCHVPGGYQKVSPLYFQVSYGGDTNNTSAGTSLLQMVSLSRSTLTVTAAPRLPVAGRSLTLTALVIQQGLGSVVSFHEHGAVLAGCSAVALSPVGGSADSGVGTCRIDALTAGSHTYVATVPSPAGSGFEQVSVVVDVVANGPLDYSDLWWGGAAENGWGVSVTQHGNTQFVVLFVYDNAGNPVWYVLPGGNWNDTANAYSGVLYRPTSSPRTAYDVSKFNSNAPVGSATITYTSDSTALLSYTIDGISGSKQIVRQPYAGDDGKARLVVNDMWWAGSQENGWGLSIDQNGPMLFPVWYTYDAAGKATFYAVPGGTWNGTTFTGDIYHPTSSAWLGVPYDARAFNPNRVGTMSLTFIDQDTAMMTYTIDGASGTSTLIRQPY